MSHIIPTRFITKVLISFNDQYLILQRPASKENNPLGRDLPGGKIEISDMTMNDGKDVLVYATMRELSEETLYTNGLPTLLREYSARKEGELVIWQLYTYTATHQTIQLSDEHISYKRVNEADLKDIDFKTPSLAKLLQ